MQVVAAGMLMRAVNSLKSVTRRVIRKMNDPSIRRTLWAVRFRLHPILPVAAAVAPIAVICEYIEQQRTPH